MFNSRGAGQREPRKFAERMNAARVVGIVFGVLYKLSTAFYSQLARTLLQEMFT